MGGGIVENDIFWRFVQVVFDGTGACARLGSMSVFVAERGSPCEDKYLVQAPPLLEWSWRTWLVEVVYCFVAISIARTPDLALQTSDGIEPVLTRRIAGIEDGAAFFVFRLDSLSCGIGFDRFDHVIAIWTLE